MNFGFIQQLKERQNQGQDLGDATSLLDDASGLRLGQIAVLNPAKDGLTPAARALAQAPGQADKLPADFPTTLGETFANEIVRRMGETTDENGEPRDSDDLREQLASTMDWLRERFGDETGAAAAGMILQSTSSGVTEESLGQGMLNVLKFIDRNFGIAAGDQAMAQFNSGINTALNEYFDNGLNELFFDAGAADGPSATQDLSSRFFAQAAQTADADAADSLDELTDLLDKLKGELDNIAQLQDLTTKLEADFNPAKASMAKGIEAYQSPAQAAEPQFTSVTV